MERRTKGGPMPAEAPTMMQNPGDTRVPPKKEIKPTRRVFLTDKLLDPEKILALEQEGYTVILATGRPVKQEVIV